MKRVKRILKFMGLILVIILVNTTPMVLIASQKSTPIIWRWLLSLLYIAVSLLITRLIWKKYQKNQPDTPISLKMTWRDFGIALLFYLATRVVAVVGTLIIQAVTGNSMSGNDAALTATDDQLLAMFPMYFVIFHLSIGFFAPIIEEFVFRGLFNQYFFKPNNKWTKMIVSSSIFALLHVFHPVEFIMYFPLGMIFYLAYSRRNNIMDSILVHLLNNGIIVVVSIISYLVMLFG